MVDSLGTQVFSIESMGFVEGFVSFRSVWCAIVAVEMCLSESCGTTFFVQDSPLTAQARGETNPPGLS